MLKSGSETLVAVVPISLFIHTLSLLICRSGDLNFKVVYKMENDLKSCKRRAQNLNKFRSLSRIHLAPLLVIQAKQGRNMVSSKVTEPQLMFLDVSLCWTTES